MASHREARFEATPYVEPSTLPSDQPKVDEVGVTSAPLKSASFFLGQFCQKYNEDFMLCKSEDRDPAHCLKEGRRVTRCAQDLCVCGEEEGQLRSGAFSAEPRPSCADVRSSSTRLVASAR